MLVVGIASAMAPAIALENGEGVVLSAKTPSPIEQPCVSSSVTTGLPDCFTPHLNQFLFEDTAIVFDWDDTLLPSTWIDRTGLMQCVHAQRVGPVNLHIPELELIAQAVKRLLSKALEHGYVIIITNAEAGWVELSTRVFMPTLLPLLQSGCVKITSARSTYEQMYPRSALAWKAAAFGKELSDALGCDATALQQMKNIVSFGDSMDERTAARIVASQRVARIKSIKFIETPQPCQSVQQLRFVHDCLESLVHHNGDLDLMLSVQ